MGNKGDIAMKVHFKLIQKSVHRGYRYSLGLVLALNESIWFAAEGFFIDSEHYKCAKRFAKH